MADGDKPKSLTVPCEVIIRRLDPDFDYVRRNQIEYDFGPKGRVFRGDPAKRGAYGHGFDVGFAAGFDSQWSNRGAKG